MAAKNSGKTKGKMKNSVEVEQSVDTQESASQDVAAEASDAATKKSGKRTYDKWINGKLWRQSPPLKNKDGETYRLDRIRQIDKKDADGNVIGHFWKVFVPVPKEMSETGYASFNVNDRSCIHIDNPKSLTFNLGVDFDRTYTVSCQKAEGSYEDKKLSGNELFDVVDTEATRRQQAYEDKKKNQADRETPDVPGAGETEAQSQMGE